MTEPRVRRAGYVFAGAAAVMAIWAAAHALHPSGPTRVPSPWAVFSEVERLAAGGLVTDVLISARRVLFGFLIGALLGSGTAFLVSLSDRIKSTIVPTASFFRYIPPTAFISIAIIYLGVGEAFQYGVIALAVVFFNFQMTIDIIDDIDARYMEIGETISPHDHGARNTLWMIANVVVPHALPRLWDIFRINISFAWTFVVITELVGANDGLGRLMMANQRVLNIEAVYACILVFGVVGLSTDRVLAAIGRRLFPWHFKTVAGDG